MPLKVTKDDGNTVALGQPVNFFVEQEQGGLGIVTLHFRDRLGFRVSQAALERPAAPRGDLDANGQPPGDAKQPGTERVANPHGVGFPQ